ncbi:MAG: hypothetical protein K0B11_19930 [Mariniphaga sp.]|nr:hypothetical protein [Mariniphaga sp.]
MNQFIHLLAFSGTGISSDYWMPSNENVKPENSIQNSFGVAKTFLDGLYELYDRKYQGSVADPSAGGYRFIPVYDNLKLYHRSLFSIFPSVSYSFKLSGKTIYRARNRLFSKKIRRPF